MTSPQCERQPGAAAQVRAPASIGCAGVPVPPPSQSFASRLPVLSPGTVQLMLWQCGVNPMRGSQGGAA